MDYILPFLIVAAIGLAILIWLALRMREKKIATE